MRQLLYQTRLQKLTQVRNGYLFLCIGLIILCVLLSGFCYWLSNRERIIVVPPVVERSFWISGQSVSSEYLSEMSLFFANLWLTVNPELSPSQQTIILRYVDPKAYGRVKNLLVALQDKLKASHLSTAFYPVTVKVDPKHFAAEVTGDLMSWIGDSQMSTQRVTYHLQYSYSEGRLLLQQFEEKPRD